MLQAIFGAIGGGFRLGQTISENKTKRLMIRNPFRDLKNNLFEEGETDPFIIYAGIGALVLIVIVLVMLMKGGKVKAGV